MTIRWLTAFIDLPEARLQAGLDFWQGITQSTLSPWRDDGAFVTLIPPAGDPYLRVQRTNDTHAGIHLDFHVDDLEASTTHAIERGARAEMLGGISLMQSPAGLRFCLVPHHGETDVPPPVRTASLPNRLDQVSVDVPAEHFDTEVTFWAQLTGWPIGVVQVDEYRSLVQPPTIPIRLIFQRLGADDTRDAARAHLDLAAGEGRGTLTGHHQQNGATLVATHRWWTTLRDPAGLPYCLTHREP